MRTLIVLFALTGAFAEEKPDHRIQLADLLIQAKDAELAAARAEAEALKSRDARDAKLAAIKEKWDAIVKAIPGYKPGCGIGAGFVLSCPEEKKK